MQLCLKIGWMSFSKLTGFLSCAEAERARASNVSITDTGRMVVSLQVGLLFGVRGGCLFQRGSLRDPRSSHGRIFSRNLTRRVPDHGDVITTVSKLKVAPE